jgi:hypothetical protein
MRRLQVPPTVGLQQQPTYHLNSDLFWLCLLLKVVIRPTVPVVVDPMVVISPMVTWIQCTVHILNIKGAEDPRSQVRVKVDLCDVRSILSLSLRQS